MIVPAVLGRFFFFFNDTATTEIYTLSLHDALPICPETTRWQYTHGVPDPTMVSPDGQNLDRKSTRLNSSHLVISYAVFCLKKKTKSRRMLSAHVTRLPAYRPCTPPSVPARADTPST